MKELSVLRVGDVAESISDTHPRKKDQLIFLNTSDVLLGNILHRDYSTVDAWPGQAKKSIKKGDILFSEIRPANGRWAFVNFDADDFVVSTKLMVIRASSEKILPRFLYHFLTSTKTTSWLQHLAESRSGTFPQITFDQISALEIAVPSLSAQAAITDLLDAVENKIQLNNRTNSTLETMSRLIFSSRQSEEHWRETPLGDVCEIFDGPHATPKLVDKGPLFLGISNLAGGRLDLRDTNHVSEDDFNRWTRRVTPMEGDVVFSYETRLGEVALIPAGIQCCLGRRMGLLRAKKDRTSPVLLLRAYLDPRFQETVRRRTIHGSTVDRIPLKDMRGFPILLPQGQDFVDLSEILAPFSAKADASDRQSNTLIQLREVLLPNLISGRIRLNEAENAFGAVA